MCVCPLRSERSKLVACRIRGTGPEIGRHLRGTSRRDGALRPSRFRELTRLTVSRPPRSRGRLPLERGAQLDELRLPLRPDGAAEVEEDLEGGGPCLVEELNAAGAGAVHVAGLDHGED